MKTNRLVLILIIIALLPLFSFSQKLPGKEIVNTFFKSKTYIVYDVGMFSSYNFYIKDVIEKEWTITEYEFISYDEFKDIIANKGGFVYAHWDGSEETEANIKEETKATIRCIPLDQKEEEGACIYSGKPSKGRVVFAKAY